MDGFGSHTFSLINSHHERVWVKFHLKTLQGIQNLAREAATRLAGENPDYATEDLFQAIERGDYPRWRLSIQVMTLAQAEHFHDNPFDLTKVWPHTDHPLIEVGLVELNRNPQNYFAEVEQAAFAPANVVPGIGFSPDKMLQARILTYSDAHRYRLGVNYESLPVNRPHSAVNTYQRDGSMRFDSNNGPAVNYQPNSFDGPTADAQYLEPPLRLTGDGARYDHRAGNDDYTQAGNLFRLMDAGARSRLVGNLVAAMAGVPKRIQLRQLTHFYRADPEYGGAVAAGLGIQLIEIEGLAQLPLPELIAATAQ
jgi:catalase